MEKLVEEEHSEELLREETIKVTHQRCPADTITQPKLLLLLIWLTCSQYS